MSLVRLKALAQELPFVPKRINTKFEVYLGEKFVCDGSFRHWKSNELRDFREYSHRVMQEGYEVTTWQEAKPTKEENYDGR
jgi:hypothetical protein